MLDLEPDPYFDKLVATAAAICKTPIALVSYLSEDWQHFKARVGLACSGTPRDIAFCAHTIKEPDILIVADALEDDRFRSNPLVTSDPFIRFYAGVPVFDQVRRPVGSVCVLDVVPRELDRIQRNNLRQLGLLVSRRLAKRAA